MSRLFPPGPPCCRTASVLVIPALLLVFCLTGTVWGQSGDADGSLLPDAPPAPSFPSEPSVPYIPPAPAVPWHSNEPSIWSGIDPDTGDSVIRVRPSRPALPPGYGYGQPYPVYPQIYPPCPGPSWNGERPPHPGKPHQPGPDRPWHGSGSDPWNPPGQGPQPPYVYQPNPWLPGGSPGQPYIYRPQGGALSPRPPHPGGPGMGIAPDFRPGR